MGVIRSIKEAKTVFIVDDSPIYREVLRHELSEFKNLQVQTFSSAEECLAKMYEKPELVILDFYLNGENKDNMTAHHAIKKMRELKVVPKILLISSERNEGLLEEYLNYRNVDFVLKTGEGTKNIANRIKHTLNQC